MEVGDSHTHSPLKFILFQLYMTLPPPPHPPPAPDFCCHSQLPCPSRYPPILARVFLVAQLSLRTAVLPFYSVLHFKLISTLHCILAWVAPLPNGQLASHCTLNYTASDLGSPHCALQLFAQYCMQSEYLPLHCTCVKCALHFNK